MGSVCVNHTVDQPCRPPEFHASAKTFLCSGGGSCVNTLCFHCARMIKKKGFCAECIVIERKQKSEKPKVQGQCRPKQKLQKIGGVTMCPMTGELVGDWD